MKKIYHFSELDCAHCAAKMENSIKKLKHVNHCSIQFMSQTMTIEIPEDYFDETMKDVIKCIHRIDSDCTLLM